MTSHQHNEALNSNKPSKLGEIWIKMFERFGMTDGFSLAYGVKLDNTLCHVGSWWKSLLLVLSLHNEMLESHQDITTITNIVVIIDRNKSSLSTVNVWFAFHPNGGYTMGGESNRKYSHEPCINLKVKVWENELAWLSHGRNVVPRKLGN